MPTSAPALRSPPVAATASAPVPVHQVAPQRRPARRLAWWAACLLCGGLIGFLFAVAGTVRGRRPTHRRVVLVSLAAAVQIVTAGYYATVSIASDLPPCPPTAGLDGSITGRVSAEDDAWRNVVNAPVSGGATFYAAARGGALCRCATNGIVVAEVPDGYARAGTMYGTIYVTHPEPGASPDRILRLSEHEARHTYQWAWATLLAGPTAFPTAYAGDELFFPGPRNHFERQAGLADGGYARASDGGPSVTGWTVFLTLTLAGGGLAALRLRFRPAGPLRAAASTQRSGSVAGRSHSLHALTDRRSASLSELSHVR
ncbi:hypothetical protein FB570_11722 [Streptomyces sp. T12]|uniref:hypothetical protein n=1 Tax=Streptomyces sp. T12 TaxID=477697 RepID=UPI0011A61594|nr:hypothetical protein [Streptomyces sp. T12]TWD13530.1 hypothetical protein FB570_11722 [Streptomyces sp. T12]